jgi:hypothetical protein
MGSLVQVGLKSSVILRNSLTYFFYVREESKFDYYLATGWTVWRSNPGAGEIFAHVQTGPGTHPASRTMGNGAFPGVKRPGPGAGHLPPSSTEVKKE